jgi:hypothetical protein
MPVDIQEAGAVGLLIDQMVFPHLVVEGARLHGVFSSENGRGNLFGARAVAAPP